MITLEEYKKPLVPYLIGIGLILFGLNLYADLAKLETQGAFTVNPLYAWLYNLGGKIAVSGFFVVIGFCLFVYTVIQFKKRQI